MFLHSLPNTLGKTYPLDSGNFSLGALLFGRATWAPLAITILVIIAFAGLLVKTRQTSDNDRAVGAQPNGGAVDNAFAIAGFGCAAILLGSPLVWWHYFVLSLPLFLYAIRPDHESEPSDHLIRFGALVPLALTSAVSRIAGNTAEIQALLTNVAVILALLLVTVQIGRNRLRRRVLTRGTAFDEEAGRESGDRRNIS